MKLIETYDIYECYVEKNVATFIDSETGVAVAEIVRPGVVTYVDQVEATEDLFDFIEQLLGTMVAVKAQLWTR